MGWVGIGGGLDACFLKLGNTVVRGERERVVTVPVSRPTGQRDRQARGIKTVDVVLPVQRLPWPMQPGGRHRLRVQQGAAGELVLAMHLMTQPRTTSQLPNSSANWAFPTDRLAAQAQDHVCS